MRLVKNISMTASSSALAQGVAAIATPALTRLYSPDQYATWAIFASIAALFSGLATMRYELAVVLPKERATAAAIGIGGIGIALVTSVSVGFVLWIAGGWFYSDINEVSVEYWWILVPITILSNSIYQISLAWCTREAKFLAYAAAQIALPILIISGQIIGAFACQRGGMGLILGSVCGHAIITCALLLFICWKNDHVVWNANQMKVICGALVAYKQYPLYMTPYTLVGVLRERLAYFLLGRFGTPDMVGFYSVAARIANIPNSFVASTLRPVFFHHAANSNLSMLEVPILIICRTLGIMAVLFLAPCVVQATWLTKIVLGPNWGVAAPYVVALSIPMIPLLMGNWLDRMFDVLGRQRLALGLELVFSMVSMTGLILGYFIFRDLYFAVCIQSGLLTIYYLHRLSVLFRIAGFKQFGLIRILFEIFLIGSLAIGVDLVFAAFMPPAMAFATALLAAMIVASLYIKVAWYQRYQIRQNLQKAAKYVP